MNITTLNDFAPDVRVRGRNAALTKKNIQSDLAAFGAGFALGPIQFIAFELDPDAGIATLAEVYPYRIARAHRRTIGGVRRWTRLVLCFARDAFVVARGDGTGCVYAGSTAKAEALLAEVNTVLQHETELVT